MRVVERELPLLSVLERVVLLELAASRVDGELVALPDEFSRVTCSAERDVVLAPREIVVPREVLFVVVVPLLVEPVVRPLAPRFTVPVFRASLAVREDVFADVAAPRLDVVARPPLPRSLLAAVRSGR